ncbi:Peptidase S8/S53 [Gracilaria domingensis]|nr:Peptidase S8/S53 [Gracilaria domingensis]
MMPQPRNPLRAEMTDDAIIPDEFLLRISSPCDAACRSEVQTLLDASNLTRGCEIGLVGIDIGPVRVESFSCDIQELRDLPERALKAFAEELIRVVSRALARGGTRPLSIVNSRTVSIPDIPPFILPEEPFVSDCILNTSRGFPFRGSLLLPNQRRLPSRIECDLFGIDETDGGFPTDGLRTCAPLSMNGRDVSVWILDTGCEPTTDGFCQDFLGPEPVPGCSDTSGHGTAVSEIATGPSGVAVESTRNCLRVFEDILPDPGIGWRTVLLGLSFVAANLNNATRGNVVNLSLSGGIGVDPLFASLVADTLEALTDMGVFIAGAAGNGGDNACTMLPAFFRDEKFFSVQAHDSESVPFEGNNISEIGADCIDISAPGVDISTSQGLVSGTSFATPHVSGAMAVLLSDEREVSSSMLTAVTRVIDNGPGLLDEFSLGLSCPDVMRRQAPRQS